MKYSIIIAVYNRTEEIGELLKSAELLDADRSIFEIIFVDDGSTDGFDRFIREYESVSGLNIKTIYQENKGPGAARNRGMETASGDYFIFVDSDCIFPTRWLAEIEKSVTKNSWDAFGGPDTAHSSFPPLLKAIDYSMTSFIGTGGTRGNKKHIGKYYPRSFNMGISRKVYETIGGMNRLRHGQDMDYSMRIYAAGFRVGLIPEAYVYHKRRTSIPKFYRQVFNWGVARINLSRRHPDTLRLIHLIPAFLIAGLILLICLTWAWPSFTLPLWLLAAFAFVAVCLTAFFQSFAKYRHRKTALLSVLTLNIQVFAYGCGLLYGIWHAAINKETAGFTKNYYGTEK